MAMSTRIRFLGHAAMAIDTAGYKILIDPFFTGNPKAAISAKDAQADFILISHGHGDHVGDSVEIAKRTGATIISNYEISLWLEQQGVKKVHGQQHGGGFNHPFGRVKLTLAFHGSALPDGSNGGNPCGFLIYLKDGKKIYHAADTGLFGDMRLIGEEGIDLAVLPIGDNYTMGPDDAIRAVKLIQPKKVIPIHYDTFPVIEQDAKAWAARVKSEAGVEVVVLQPGSEILV
jgi:L-ascorbate metabolism protein UlaG (beta-lactamase superfamily)